MKRLLSLVLLIICVFPLWGSKPLKVISPGSQPEEYIIFDYFAAKGEAFHLAYRIYLVNSEIGYFIIAKDGYSPKNSLLSEILGDGSILYVLTSDISTYDWGFKQLPNILLHNKDKIITEPPTDYYETTLSPIYCGPYSWYLMTYVNRRENEEIKFFNLDIDNERFRTNFRKLAKELSEWSNTICVCGDYQKSGKNFDGLTLPESYIKFLREEF